MTTARPELARRRGFSPTARSRSAASMLKVAASTSTNTGVAPTAANRAGGRGEGEGRHEDGVAGLHAHRHQRDHQRVAAARYADHVADAGVGGEPLLQLFHLRARARTGHGRTPHPCGDGARHRGGRAGDEGRTAECWPTGAAASTGRAESCLPPAPSDRRRRLGNRRPDPLGDEKRGKPRPAVDLGRRTAGNGGEEGTDLGGKVVVRDRI